ncbi:MAG TPA: SDR family NAD(P)-dependent oxidoreductase [Kofleriaceae bacterium]
MSQQHPIPSGFGAQTTAREVIGERRLDGKTAIVTGGYAGLGAETTRVLAAAGARVIVPARDLAKATRAPIAASKGTPSDPASVAAEARTTGRPACESVAVRPCPG